MKTSILAAGIVILVIGIAVFAYGYAYPNTTSTTTTQSLTTKVVSVSSQNVGPLGTWEAGTVLSKGATLKGTFSVQGFNSTAGPYFFYVENKSEFIKWGNCSPCAANTEVNGTPSSAGSYSFTLLVPADDTYFFVFDAEGYNASSTVSVNANSTLSAPQATSSTMPNTLAEYAGLALIAVGVIVAAVSFLASKGPAKPKPARQTTTPEGTTVSSRPGGEPTTPS